MGGGGDAVGFIATPGSGNIQPRIDGADAAIEKYRHEASISSRSPAGAELPAEDNAINGYVLAHKER